MPNLAEASVSVMNANVGADPGFSNSNWGVGEGRAQKIMCAHHKKEGEIPL